MPAQKRDHEGNGKAPTPTADVDMDMETSEPETKSAIISTFEHYRAELDEHHDRRERIIKASRDITALSKKIIFSLQRVRTLSTPLPPKIASECTARKSQITTLFTSLLPDLTPPNNHRYSRQISGAIQEYIEAISFEHYLVQGRLITFEECQAQIPGCQSAAQTSSTAGKEEGGGKEQKSGRIILTQEDYLLGIFDLTGEMMRFGITAIATTGRLPTSPSPAPSSSLPPPTTTITQADLLHDLRTLRAGFAALFATGKFGAEMEKKADVMRQSVEKVERAAYGIVVRGKERPEGWVPDLNFGGGGGGGGEEGVAY